MVLNTWLRTALYMTILCWTSLNCCLRFIWLSINQLTEILQLSREFTIQSILAGPVSELNHAPWYSSWFLGHNHIHIHPCGGFQLVMGVPQARWMVFVRENANLKWMITRGSPNYGNPQMAKPAQPGAHAAVPSEPGSSRSLKTAASLRQLISGGTSFGNLPTEEAVSSKDL